jgi:hypothetical protein
MNSQEHRLKFYGMNDMGTFMFGDRLKKVIDIFNENKSDYCVTEIIEFYNALLFLNNNVFIKEASDDNQTRYTALKPKLQKTIATFFNSINTNNIAKLIVDIDYDYHSDLIAILTNHKVYERVDAITLLDTLKATQVNLGEILENKTLVNAYDKDIRALILANTKHAELLISKYLEKNSRRIVNLPPSFTANDTNTLLNQYIDSNNANPNYLELIANSRTNQSIGLDPKTKLKAKQKHEAWTKEFFKTNKSGVSFGIQVSIADEQEEPLIISEKNKTTIFSYSRKWLDENPEPISIIGAFINLFGFVDNNMILTLPSYNSSLGVFERFMRVNGKDTYPTGIAFQFKEISAFYQTLMYDQYLKNKNTSLEAVVEWFFADYAKNRFGIKGLKYTPATQTATYLEKCRHIFAEMDSIIKQFSLFVENGELDYELLRLTSDAILYKDIPSLLNGKYAYITDNSDIITIQHYLFSDQSSLTYINESLKGSDLVSLIVKNKVSYDDFLVFQKPAIDKLITLGILEDSSGHMQFHSKEQVVLLRRLFKVEALNYYQCSAELRAEIDEMVKKNWLIRKGTLLTTAESSLFNYYLNQHDYGNGLDLRNKYIHGSQASSDNENAHYKTYIIALELLIALVIKMSNDFLLNEQNI